MATALAVGLLEDEGGQLERDRKREERLGEGQGFSGLVDRKTVERGSASGLRCSLIYQISISISDSRAFIFLENFR